MSWLNVDFVPDNRVAHEAAKAFDAHWEESRRLQQLANTASQYPIDSPERNEIMQRVISGAMVNDVMAALR